MQGRMHGHMRGGAQDRARRRRRGHAWTQRAPAPPAACSPECCPCFPPPPPARQVASTLCALGSLALQRGNTANAEGAYRRALQVRARPGPPATPRTREGEPCARCTRGGSLRQVLVSARVPSRADYTGGTGVQPPRRVRGAGPAGVPPAWRQQGGARAAPCAALPRDQAPGAAAWQQAGRRACSPRPRALARLGPRLQPCGARSARRCPPADRRPGGPAAPPPCMLSPPKLQPGPYPCPLDLLCTHRCSAKRTQRLPLRCRRSPTPCSTWAGGGPRLCKQQ